VRLLTKKSPVVLMKPSYLAEAYLSTVKSHIKPFTLFVYMGRCYNVATSFTLGGVWLWVRCNYMVCRVKAHHVLSPLPATEVTPWAASPLGSGFIFLLSLSQWMSTPQHNNNKSQQCKLLSSVSWVLC